MNRPKLARGITRSNLVVRIDPGNRLWIKAASGRQRRSMSAIIDGLISEEILRQKGYALK